MFVVIILYIFRFYFIFIDIIINLFIYIYNKSFIDQLNIYNLIYSKWEFAIQKKKTYSFINNK